MFFNYQKEILGTSFILTCGGTTYREYTIQFQLVPGGTFIFFVRKISNNPGTFCFKCRNNFVLGDKKKGVSRPTPGRSCDFCYVLGKGRGRGYCKYH